MRFHEGSTKVPPFHLPRGSARAAEWSGTGSRFHQGFTRVRRGSARASGWSGAGSTRVPRGSARAAGWSGAGSTRVWFLQGLRGGPGRVPPAVRKGCGFHQGSTTRVPPEPHDGSTSFCKGCQSLCKGCRVARGSPEARRHDGSTSGFHQGFIRHQSCTRQALL